MASKKYKTRHVIKKWSISAHTILCDCGWFGGDDQEWNTHKAERRNDPVPADWVKPEFAPAPRLNMKARRGKSPNLEAILDPL